ncbi:MAG: 2'-5' RNA ligase family protein [Cyanobacteria bacterium J06659_2]
MILQRFFLALVPPPDIQTHANAIKQDFSDRFDSRAAQKSPPHITLQPPFEWAKVEIERLNTVLSTFAQRQVPVSITLSGFGAFPPRVIYIDVVQTPELMQIQQALAGHLAETLEIVDPRSRDRTFMPHMTVAFRDLKPKAFRLAWPDFETRSLHFEFTATHLTLLVHNGHRWNVAQNYGFSLTRT